MFRDNWFDKIFGIDHFDFLYFYFRMKQIDIADLDVVFLTFDEPKKEETVGEPAIVHVEFFSRVVKLPSVESAISYAGSTYDRVKVTKRMLIF